MENILERADNLTRFATDNLELDERDVYYIRNRILELLQNCDAEQLTADEEDEIYGTLSLLPAQINNKIGRAHV